MLQDIFPHNIDITYKNIKPEKESVILCFLNENILVSDDNSKSMFPLKKDVINEHNYIYLFSISEKKYFLVMDKIEIEGFSYIKIKDFRNDIGTKEERFAGLTGYHLFKWYDSNRFCGKCGNELKHGENMRMLYCDKCHKEYFPSIYPVIIVALKNGDKLLMTKYAQSHSDYANYALVAGFTEIGETAEDTVRRELFEETGLKAKNIRYYKSQPWGLTQTLLIGFVAELDGDDKIKIDDSELKEAQFIKREDIKIKNNDVSLTNELIMMFKENKI